MKRAVAHVCRRQGSELGSGLGCQRVIHVASLLVSLLPFLRHFQLVCLLWCLLESHQDNRVVTPLLSHLGSQLENRLGSRRVIILGRFLECLLPCRRPFHPVSPPERPLVRYHDNRGLLFLLTDLRCPLATLLVS